MTETGQTPEQIARTLLLPYLNHAVRMYEASYASRDDIDAAMRFGCGYPKGPLTTLDELGLATVRDQLAARYAETGDDLHKPADLLETMVAEGRTFAGELSGSGDEAPQLRHEVAKVGVVGTGTMAAGIVQVFAQAGYDVVFVGRSDEKADAVVAGITKALDKAIERGKLDQDGKSAVIERLIASTEREALGDVDIVVEAIAEDLEIKLELFRDLDRICKPGAILATTTSSLPVVECASVTSRPQDVIGMHFFNPAQVMKLVEVVHTVSTAADVIATVQDLCAKVGKHAVTCGDRSGFIVNALLFPYLNDAVRMLSANYASADDIDTAMKTGCGLPMGPFELLDVVGLDVSLAIQRELYLEFREPGFAPAPLLEHLVTAGYLGRKTGRGFRTYA